MTGTIRLGKGVRLKRNLKKADDEIVDATYRNRIQGLHSVGQPARDGKAQLSFGRYGVNPTGLREEDESYLRRSPFWSVTPDYRDSNRAGQRRRSQQRP
jgi:hypothetical protein